MTDRSSLSRPALVALAVGAVGALGLVLWRMEGAAEASEDPAAGREGDLQGSVALQERSTAGERIGAGAAPVAVDGLARLTGRVDLGAAAGRQIGELRVVAFEQSWTAEELFGFETDEDETDEPGAARRLEPELFDWSAELARLAPAAIGTVDGEGRFELDVPVEFGAAHLALVGDMVNSPRTQRVELSGEGTDGLVLHGRAGCLIEGRLIPDPSLSAVDLSAWTVQLERGFTGSIDMMSASADLFARSAAVRPDGRFRVRGFPIEGRFDLLAVGPDAGPGQALALELAPGATVRADVVLSRGANLRGQILDTDGDPVAGAEVRLARSRVLSKPIQGLGPAVADDYGRFEFEHALTGRVQLVVSAEGFLAKRMTLPERVESGDSVEDIWIELQRGQTLSGLVRHADGRPAEGVAVKIELPAEMRAGKTGFGPRDMGGEGARTDANGAFEVRGLGDFEFDVIASFEDADGTAYQSYVEAVESGGQAMELLLEPSQTLAGRVLSAAGRPVQEFELTLRRAIAQSAASNPFELSGRTETRPFRDGAGTFEFDRLEPGAWEVRAEAPGFTASDWLAVELPSGGVADLVLEESAWTYGRVLDPMGAPVAGARVELVQDLGERLRRLRNGGIGFAVTDSAGEFRFEVDAGRVGLRAFAMGYGLSADLDVETRPGERRGGLLLALTEPGQLTGEAFGSDDVPLASGMASLQRVPRYDTSLTARLDDEGRFRFDAVTAGRYQLMVVPALDEQPADVAELLSAVLIETVEVRKRESVHRVLGRTLESAVNVAGTVLLRGEPVPEALLSWFPADDEGLVSWRLTNSDEGGAFAVELARPGAYQVLVQPTEGRSLSQSQVWYSRRIVDGLGQEPLTFELPVGRIAGRVLDSGGEPVSSCRVALHADSGCVISGVFGHDFVEVKTDAEGAFEVRFLNGGQYRLIAGGRSRLGALGTDGAPARSPGLSVELAENSELVGLELRLPPLAQLAGGVVDESGAPVGDANIFVRNPDGALVDRLSVAQASASGRFEIEGLGPGEYRVSARLGSAVTAQDVTVQVLADEPAEVQLVLAPGTLLRVEVLDLGAEEVRTAFDSGALLSVVDATGAEHATLASVGDLYEAYSTGFSESARTVGPLAPGRYTVRVRTADGRSKSKAVELAGQNQRSLKLRLR